jgi:Flp pilus assembly protein TadD
VFSAAALAVVSGLAWHWRRHGYFLTGWLWFLGMLVPVIGLVQVGEQAMADRYTYLPAVGLFVAAAFGLAEVQGRFKLPLRALAAGALVILGACVVATEHQLAFWRTTETVFQRAVAVTKNNGAAHMILAVDYKKQGRADEAQQQFQAAMDCFALVMVPGEGAGKRTLAAQMELTMGRTVELKGDADGAVQYYREAVRMDPNFFEAHTNLGSLLAAAGKPEEALVEFQAAVRLRPGTPAAHKELGTQLARLGRFDDALREYTAAVGAAPNDPQLYYLMGRTQLRRGQSAAAVTAFRKALSLSPADGPTLVYLARVLAADESPQNRNGAEAAALAEQANRLTGGTQSFVLGTLAMAYAETGRFDEARKTVQAAIQRNTGGGPETAADLAAQLKTYEAGQPWRESFGVPGPTGQR